MDSSWKTEEDPATPNVEKIDVEIKPKREEFEFGWLGTPGQKKH